MKLRVNHSSRWIRPSEYKLQVEKHTEHNVGGAEVYVMFLHITVIYVITICILFIDVFCICLVN